MTAWIHAAQRTSQCREQGGIISSSEVGYTLIALCVLVLLPALATRQPHLRRYLGPRLARLADRLADRMRQQFEPDEEVDPYAAELYRIRRCERLRSDVARLQRILATDESMSATRQLGNRIAYEWLVAELARTRSQSRNIFADQFLDSWATLTPSSTAPRLITGSARGSTVEVLDIGWRG